MAKNVANVPAVAKAVARIKKAAQRLREAQDQLKEARKKLRVAVEQAQQQKGVRISRGASHERLALIEQKLLAVSPQGLSMEDLCTQCALKRPTMYQLLRQLVATSVVRAASKGHNARWSLMRDPAPVYERSSKQQRVQDPASKGKRQKAYEEYEQAILGALALAGAEGVPMSGLRELLPEGSLLARASNQVLGYYLRGLADAKKVTLIGHARGARWSVAGALPVRKLPVVSRGGGGRRVDYTIDSPVASVALNKEFLATVPQVWRDGLQGPKLRPSSSGSWMDLAILVWELYPHRTFEEFERLVIVYAPYSRYDIATIAGSYREERLREAYLNLQKQHGDHIDATPLPPAVRDRVVVRGATKKPLTVRPIIAKTRPVPQVDVAPVNVVTASEKASKGARPPGSYPVKYRRLKEVAGDRYCSYIKDDGLPCGTKLRPTNAGEYCSVHQDKVDWDKFIRKQ